MLTLGEWILNVYSLLPVETWFRGPGSRFGIEGPGLTFHGRRFGTKVQVPGFGVDGPESRLYAGGAMV